MKAEHGRGWMVSAMLVGVMAAWVPASGGARAGELEQTARWAAGSTAGAVSNRLHGAGLTNAADITAVMDGWDEALVVERSLAAKAYPLLVMVGRQNRLSASSLESIREALRAEESLTGTSMSLIELMPVDWRGEFAEQLDDLVGRGGVYAGQPVFGRHHLKYAVLGGERPFSERVDAVDLVGVLIAPELLTLRQTDVVKRTIRDAAVRLARVKLRADGGSFVVRDGVNPLSEAIGPVVEALNAPMAAGLEAALRGLGVEAPDMERAELEAVGAQWREELLLGERSGSGVTAVLGKLSVVLGVEGFNDFVELYNHGSGTGADDEEER